MKNKYFLLLMLLFLSTGCASKYIVPQNVNDLSQKLSYDKAVEIVSQRFKLTKSSDGYGLCMGSDTPGANWLMAATTKYNFKIDRKRAQFAVRQAGATRTSLAHTGAGTVIATDSKRHTTVKTVIFQDITKVNIKKASWTHACGMGVDSGLMINLFEGEGKVAIVVIKENTFDEFMAAMLKLNSNPQLEIYK